MDHPMTDQHQAEEILPWPVDMDEEVSQQLELFPLVNLDLPHDQKWDVLQPILHRLYLGEGQSFKNIAQSMRDVYEFTAYESEYKYRFRKWGWKRNVSKKHKEVICTELQTRAAAGKRSAFKISGREVDQNKLRRYMKDDIRHANALGAAMQLSDAVQDPGLLSNNALSFGNMIFSNWNLPYQALIQSRRLQRPSPAFSNSKSPFPNLSIITPSPNGPSPQQAQLSPFVRAQTLKQAIESTNLLLSGQHALLAKSLSPQQVEPLADWLHQFWYFAFKSAKSWGRGPRKWDREMLRFRDCSSVPRQRIDGVVTSPLSHRTDGLSHTPGRENAILQPPSLCRWSVHVDEDLLEGEESITETDLDKAPIPDPHDERTWQPWSDIAKRSFPDIVLEGLASNSFATVDATTLPISLPKVAEASLKSRMQFLKESLTFAIMGHNPDLVGELCREVDEMREDVGGPVELDDFHPFHLAASYLDGAHACCNIIGSMNFLVRGADRKPNALGHTILDSLMLTILRSHTCMTPAQVDIELRDEIRFSGEEVDICGRWDADSDCYRGLLSSGISSIPGPWKHKFCHTSSQAICHFIDALNSNTYYDDGASGLFIKRCTSESCGLKMTLSKYHTLVMVAYKLAQHGADDEDLFGIICVVSSLLSRGLRSVSCHHDISPQLLFEEEGPLRVEGGCLHRMLLPSQLAHSLPHATFQSWSSRKRLGWRIFTKILDLAELEEIKIESLHGEQDLSSEYANCGECTHWENGFGSNQNLKLLFQAVQTELLTYRRQSETDPWLSDNISLEQIDRTLLSDGDIDVGRLAHDKLMKPPCKCGSNLKQIEDMLPYSASASDCCATYFSNLGDNWQLLTPLEQMGYHW